MQDLVEGKILRESRENLPRKNRNSKGIEIGEFSWKYEAEPKRSNLHTVGAWVGGGGKGVCSGGDYGVPGRCRKMCPISHLSNCLYNFLWYLILLLLWHHRFTNQEIHSAVGYWQKHPMTFHTYARFLWTGACSFRTSLAWRHTTLKWRQHGVFSP